MIAWVCVPRRAQGAVTGLLLAAAFTMSSTARADDPPRKWSAVVRNRALQVQASTRAAVREISARWGEVMRRLRGGETEDMSVVQAARYWVRQRMLTSAQMRAIGTDREKLDAAIQIVVSAQLGGQDERTQELVDKYLRVGRYRDIEYTLDEALGAAFGFEAAAALGYSARALLTFEADMQAVGAEAGLRDPGVLRDVQRMGLDGTLAKHTRASLGIPAVIARGASARELLTRAADLQMIGGDQTSVADNRALDQFRAGRLTFDQLVATINRNNNGGGSNPPAQPSSPRHPQGGGNVRTGSVVDVVIDALFGEAESSTDHQSRTGGGASAGGAQSGSNGSGGSGGSGGASGGDGGAAGDGGGSSAPGARPGGQSAGDGSNGGETTDEAPNGAVNVYHNDANGDGDIDDQGDGFTVSYVRYSDSDGDGALEAQTVATETFTDTDGDGDYENAAGETVSNPPAEGHTEVHYDESETANDDQDDSSDDDSDNGSDADDASNGSGVEFTPNPEGSGRRTGTPVWTPYVSRSAECYNLVLHRGGEASANTTPTPEGSYSAVRAVDSIARMIDVIGGGCPAEPPSRQYMERNPGVNWNDRNNGAVDPERG